MTALGGERAALVEAVMPFLDQWQGLLKDTRQLTPERVSSMLDRAETLRQQADHAGQGGVVHHLDVCIECLKAPALDRRGFQEALRNLSEVTWQLKQDAGPRRGADAGPPSMLQPPLLSGQQSSVQPPVLPSNASVPPGLAVPPGLVSISSRSGFEPPPPISLPGGGGQGRPPNVELSLRPGQVERAPSVIERSRGGAAPVVAPQPPPPAPPPPPVAPAFKPAGPSILKKAAHRSPPPPEPPPPPPQQEQPVAAPRILGGRGSAAPQARPKEKPNLMVATMFGLRAFGRGRGGGAPEPPPQQRGSRPSPAAPPPQVLEQKGVLGLGKRDRKGPSDVNGVPGWIGPREGGLPELASGGPPSLLDTGGSDLDDRLRKLREGEDSRGDRRSPTRPPRGSSADRSRSGSSRSSRDLLARDYEPRRRDGGFPFPWWIGGVAVAVVGIVVVVVLVLGHRPGSAQPDEPNVAAGDGPVMPTSKLLDDKERMRVLMSLVHSYGGEESPELADLVNEEAALVYEVLEQNCDQPGDKCQRPVPMVAGTVRSGATPQNEIHHLFEDRKLASTKKNKGQGPKWLAGLTMPAIGAGDDPYLHKLLDYYTVNQNGREEFKNMLFRCGAYLDLIERTLVHYGMPKVLLALVMTESMCVPNAESPVGARGLWQFMPATARAYHLNVKEGVVDERISPPKSTDAAVKFISDLYRKMNNWEFALASYNMGAFGLSARIRRAGGDVTFWDLSAAGYLPEETSKYVPRIQAYAVILENLAHFNLATAQSRAPEVTAEIEAEGGTRLGMLAQAASTSVDHLKLLNPDIVGTLVPATGNSFMVQVPKESAARARSMLEQLIAAGNENDLCVPSGFDWGAEPFDDSMCAGSEAPPKKKKKKY